MQNRGPFVSPHGLDLLGIDQVQTIFWNLNTPSLYEEAVRRNEARISKGGPLVAMTGIHTGRSANDKAWIDLLITGPMMWVFITSALFIWFAPWWWLIWNKVRRSVNGPIIAAILILIGLFLDRVRLFVTAWSVPTESIHDKYLTVIPEIILPGILDILIIIGGISLAILPVLIISRIIPVVSIWEIQQFNLLSKPVKYIKTHGVQVAKPD